jgi:hypothetical protein
METVQSSTERTIRHHIDAFNVNNFTELIKDYTEQSEIWTINGKIIGLKAISDFFSAAFSLFPKDKTHFQLQQIIVTENKGYVVWNADTPFVTVPLGTDSFEVRGDKIIWQTTANYKMQKR